MPPARVHKVILCLSKPSTPDTPAATPAAMPVPLPPLGLQQAPPTSPMPPPPLRPPNQLPSNAGLPIPNNSQHSVGTQENLLTYVPPHAGMFYPPVPAYPQHPPPFPPYGGINTVQPWTYTQYTPQQLAELSRRFPVHPLAIEHATVGGGDSLTHEARGRVANGPVDQDLHAHKDARVGVGGTKANVAAPEDAQEGRFYPNKVVGPGGKFHSHLRAVKLLADCLNLKCGSSRLT
jgi:hypothetical protein